ncbi:MAG: zinc ribbon domain-containing protein [Deltaproteobacteria bacterium]
MPLYEYRCGACSRIFEAYTRLSDEGKTPVCPACGGAAEKIGISLFGTAGSGNRSGSGVSTCGGGSRRSPFS